MIIMKIIIIIIALKGAIRDLFTISSLRHSNTYAQVANAQSCANHVQHIKHLSRVTHRGTKGQLSYKVGQS